jgi:hypothetical protein
MIALVQKQNYNYASKHASSLFDVPEYSGEVAGWKMYLVHPEVPEDTEINFQHTLMPAK